MSFCSAQLTIQQHADTRGPQSPPECRPGVSCRCHPASLESLTPRRTPRSGCSCAQCHQCLNTKSKVASASTEIALRARMSWQLYDRAALTTHLPDGVHGQLRRANIYRATAQAAGKNWACTHHPRSGYAICRGCGAQGDSAHVNKSTRTKCGAAGHITANSKLLGGDVASSCHLPAMHRLSSLSAEVLHCRHHPFHQLAGRQQITNCRPEEGCRDCICGVALVNVVLQHQPLVEGRRQ